LKREGVCNICKKRSNDLIIVEATEQDVCPYCVKAHFEIAENHMLQSKAMGNELPKLYDTNYYRREKYDTPCFFDICIDEQKKVIHVLDIGRFATSVTNCVSREMQRFILDHYYGQLDTDDMDIDNWKWLFYGTDCVISEYTSVGFVHWSLTRIAPDQLMVTRMKKIWGDE
jgi:hypothetical protein